VTAQPVQAVFFWRADGKSAFKAIYGRKPKDPVKDSYTKDYHQPRHGQARALERAMGIPVGGDTAVEWRWPGGSYPRGRLKAAKDFATQGGRLNLRWETDNAPPPWRLIEEPTELTLSTLRGTPDLASESGADQQLAAMQAAGETPWLVAVHLVGEGAVLHARVVLENPQAGREFASWDNLPAKVRAAMAALASRQPGGFVEFKEGPAVTNELVLEILEALEESPNVLLVGPPGTGKTVALEALKKLYDIGTDFSTVTFDPDLLHGAFGEQQLADAGVPRCRSLVFHPSYAYEHFVMGLLPDLDRTTGQVIVRPHVGPLLELAQFASQPGRRALLLLDEFNRGAAAAIFGDTLALIDGDKRSTPGDTESGAKIATPYAHLGPTTPEGPLGADVSLPSTLKIVAALNSADRSVAPLDAALRRRFAIIYVGPNYDALADHLQSGAADLTEDPAHWSSEHVRALAIAILKAMNDRIESILGRDFLLGPSVFWHVRGDDRDDALRSLAIAIDNKVMGTLALTFTDSDDQLAGVLKISESPSGPEAATWVDPDVSIQRLAARRLRPVRFRDLEAAELILTLQSLL
jgi:5-methylcytosine-specific restriction protein B